MLKEQLAEARIDMIETLLVPCPIFSERRIPYGNNELVTKTLWGEAVIRESYAHKIIP